MNGEYISIETAKIMGAIDKENKELQERIDKAIEYVSNLCNYANVEYYSGNQLRYITIRPYYIEKLLNILKGKQND